VKRFLSWLDPRTSAHIRGKLSQPFEQLCQLNPEALGKLLHTQKRQVALSTLYLPDVRPMQANLLLCSLLRPSPRFPQFADPLAECAF
jgi:hypothetical protein